MVDEPHTRSPAPLVSVIIPTYNRSRTILRAIQSVREQTYSNREIIVVDDGSTDDTREQLAALSSEVQYLRQENAGPAAARNRGVAAARGEWLAFLDSDDTWLPGKLERQVNWTIDCGADMSFHDLPPPSTEKTLHTWSDYVLKGEANSPSISSNVLDNAFQLVTTCGHLFLTTTFITRREAYLAVGGMQSKLRTSEDIELYLKLFARYKVAFLREILASYTPAENRAVQVACRSEGQREKQSKIRVQLDRARAFALGSMDRLTNNDLPMAKIAHQGMIRSLKSLAGEHRRAGSWIPAILAYARQIGLASVPLESSLSLAAVALDLKHFPGFAKLP